MDIADWRKQIDEIDSKLVELLNERAHGAKEIGELKRNTHMPIYEPDRERLVFEHVRRVNRGPLPDRELLQIFERIVDVMRKIQHDQAQPESKRPRVSGDTELEAESNE
jgi:chorismate mutase